MIMEARMATSQRRKKVARNPLKPPKTALKKSCMDSLPMELVVEVVALVASTTQTPILDLKNLRTTCKLLYRASMDKIVGRRMALENEQHVAWKDRERYLAFLRACADAENKEANCTLGMEEVYNMGETASGLHHLKKAAEDGHNEAAYTIGLFMLRDSTTQQLGVEILDRLAAKDAIATCGAPEKMELGRTLIHRCRGKTLSMLGKIWNNRKLAARKKQCTTEACGRILSMDCIEDQYWVEGDNLEREFCSSLCRWIYEYNAFVKRLYNCEC